MSATTCEQLGELYLETLSQDAYYEGAAGTICDAVLMALSGDNKANAAIGSLDAAQKLTHDAMGFLERTISRISSDCLDNRCDWVRIDAAITGKCDPGELSWVTEQLGQQGDRAWSAFCNLATQPQDNGYLWHHDLATAATLLKAAALLLKEVDA